MIARRRKRSRVHSASYRTLYWLVRIEAQYVVAYGALDAYRDPWVRLHFLRMSTIKRARRCATALRLWPRIRSTP